MGYTNKPLLDVPLTELLNSEDALLKQIGLGIEKGREKRTSYPDETEHYDHMDRGYSDHTDMPYVDER